MNDEMDRKVEEYKLARALRRPSSEPTIPRCLWCSHQLTLQEAGETRCLGCQDKALWQEKAWELSRLHGVQVRWTSIRDHGSVEALRLATEAKYGMPMEWL